MKKSNVFLGILLFGTAMLFADVKTEQIPVDNLHNLTISFNEEKQEVELAVSADASTVFDESYVNSIIDESLSDFMIEYNFSSSALTFSELKDETDKPTVILKRYVLN